jgi:protein-tyrosine phosphatase
VGPLVTDATVEVEGNGDALLVNWSLAGADVGVDIGVGRSPDAIDHRHTLTVAAGPRSARIDGLGSGRHYVSVAPHGGGGAIVVAERRLPFEGVTNFRDLGGYPTADGRRTRWGRVFRSDALHRLTPEDRRRYESLRLHAVFDLRGDLERERYPNPFPSVQFAVVGQSVEAGAPPPGPLRATGRGRW